MRKKTIKTIDPLLIKVLPVESSRGDKRKAQIIDAAIDLIATKGIEETNFETIGKELGIRRSHVAYHFKKRDLIISTCVDYLIASAHEYITLRLKESEPGLPRLKTYLAANLQWFTQHPKRTATFILFYYYASINSDYQKKHTLIRETGTDRVISILQEIKSQKLSSSQQRSIAKTIQALITGTFIEILSTNQSDIEKIGEQKSKELFNYAQKLLLND